MERVVREGWEALATSPAFAADARQGIMELATQRYGIRGELCRRTWAMAAAWSMDPGDYAALATGIQRR
jgi:hypothetical protein